jgi:hypothetical protein
MRATLHHRDKVCRGAVDVEAVGNTWLSKMPFLEETMEGNGRDDEENKEETKSRIDVTIFELGPWGLRQTQVHLCLPQQDARLIDDEELGRTDSRK